MKISKFELLRLVAKHLCRKLGNPSADYTLIATSLAPMFNQQEPRMRLAGIIDEEHRVDVDLLSKKLIELFNITPFFHIPMGEAKIIITKRDIEIFVDDLKKYADIEEPVICLPCSN